MKRFHLHVSVENLDESIRFYSTLFAEQPTVQQLDYAKWMLDDPRVNFAISTQRQPLGVNHLGFQVDSSDELHALHTQLLAADSQLNEESEQPCCYAKSDKYWVTDPTGIAWETFHTLGSIPVYGKDTRVVDHRGSVTTVLSDAHRRSECCVPADKIGVTAFRQAFRSMATRIELFLSLPIASIDRMRLKERMDEIGRTPPPGLSE